MTCTRAIYTRLHGEPPLPVTTEQTEQPSTRRGALLGLAIAVAVLAGIALVILGIAYGGGGRGRRGDRGASIRKRQARQRNWRKQMTSTLEAPEWMTAQAEIVEALAPHGPAHRDIWGSRDGEIWLRLTWRDRSTDDVAAIAADVTTRGGQLLDRSATGLRAGWQLTEAEPVRTPRRTKNRNGGKK